MALFLAMAELEQAQFCSWLTERVVIVVKVVLVVFLTYPNGIEAIEWTNFVVKRCKCCIGCLLRLSSHCHRKQREKYSLVEPLNEKKNHG